jgi:hypothetical protein
MRMRRRSKLDWHGGPSLTPSERVHPTSCARGPAAAGPHELWTRFDAAVQQLNEAGAGDNLGHVMDAYAALAQASELADALQAAGE